MKPAGNSKTSGAGSGPRQPNKARRVHRRAPCRDLIRLGTTRTNLISRMEDASPTGLCCRVPNGLPPKIGETVLVEWPDRSQSFAQVRWIDRDRIGLELDSFTGDFSDRIDPASLGADWFSRLTRLQSDFQDLGQQTA